VAAALIKTAAVQGVEEGEATRAVANIISLGSSYLVVVTVVTGS
jgi:hypothetical protein